MAKTENFIGVRCDITMHRTLYLSRPDNITDDQFINKAKQEIILPHNVLAQLDNVLQMARINPTGFDLKDWSVDNVEYSLCGENQSKHE